MKRTMAKLVIAMTTLVLAIGFWSNSQPASGWSAFPFGGTHSELADRVIRWMADEGWRYQGEQIHADDWQLLVGAAAAPDAVHDYDTWQDAVKQLQIILGKSLFGPGLPLECSHALCWAMQRDFEQLKAEAGQGWHKPPGAVTAAIEWIQGAKSAPNKDTALIWAGYALHYGQDAVNPPHADPWEEGLVTATFCGLVPPIPIVTAPNPHTLWEIKDQGLLGRYWDEIHLTPPAGFSPGDVQPPRLQGGIEFHVTETDLDWPEPANPSDWRIYDPFSDAVIESDCERALTYLGYLLDFDIVLGMPVRTDRPDEIMTNDAKAKNALWRAAVLSRDLLIYAFDLEPPGGWPGEEPPSANVDVALIIDSSGSMTWNDPANKRLDAAKAYLTASLEGDFVGVVDFDSGVRVASPLQRLPDNKTSLTNAINTINSSGGTNVGIGVQAGCNVLIASTSGNATKAAILLTDGQGSFSGQDSCFKDRGWPIYTFGFGSANDALLQQIASNTGGEFARLPTTDLVCEFQRVRTKIAGGSPGPCTATHVDPGTTTSFLASIPPGQAQATFSTSWIGSDVVMTLTTPSGRVIDRNTVAPDVVHDSGPTFEVYSITNPEPGDWEVDLFGADVPVGGEDVIFSATTIPLTGDSVAPVTTISLAPAAPDGANGWYVSPVTVTLTAEDDPGGSGVASTEYRLDGGAWQLYVAPFTLSTDGATTVDARSTDNAANVEDPPASATVQIDQTAPGVNIEVPAEGVAVQDGVTLAASANDATSGIADVRLYVREDDNGSGIPVGYEGLAATYNSATGHWEYSFDSTALPDGYYVALAKAEDNAGNESWSEVRHFSVRNWAVLELLPASESNKAGRTMPVKFSLRIAAAVDPAQPFVYNEDLTIKIYETGYPADVLQTSAYGDTARDYRVDTVGEKYITNFKTLKRPKDYTVEIWRHNFLDFLVGDFGFSTVK